MIYILILFCLVFLINRLAINASLNSQNEDIKRALNQKILQNRKIDELYGRKLITPREEIERAIVDLAKDKKQDI